MKMSRDTLRKLVIALCIIFGVSALTTGHMIMGFVALVVVFGIHYTLGSSSFRERNAYERETEALPDLSVEALYEKLRELDTPLGKPWLGSHYTHRGNCVIFGPGVFKDYVLIAKEKERLVVETSSNLDNLTVPEDQKWRLEQLIDTKGVVVTPKKYSGFVAYKEASAVMLDDLRELIEEIGREGRTAKTSLDLFRAYYYYGKTAVVRDMDDNEYGRCVAVFYPLSVTIYDPDGEEMAACTGNRKDVKSGFRVTMSGEDYGTIYKDNGSAHDEYYMDTPDGEYRIVSYPALRRANVSSNYRVLLNGVQKAILAGSAKIEFEAEGLIENDVIVSYDDDYLLAYILFQDFLMTLNHFVR